MPIEQSKEMGTVPVGQAKSFILKAALFATGLSGIVAEYILSTLATYFLGNSTLQWSMVLSTMLFSMGLGSRISKIFQDHLLAVFISIEFILSLLVSFCAMLAYMASNYAIFNTSLDIYTFPFDGIVIYTMAILIGLLIGMEIPLVMRLNETFESLRVNVAAVMEKDYYGSLVGGVFFAFVGLPILGLTYTPFILGIVNFSVAFILVISFRKLLPNNARNITYIASAFVLFTIIWGIFNAENIINTGEQKRYLDRIIYQKQTKYQRIVLTNWKNDYWLYLNGNQQLSTFDEHLYHEPLVHPAMQLLDGPSEVLVLGGGDGCAVREILKYPSVKRIKLVDLDPEMTRLAMEHPVFLEMNDSALHHPAVEILNTDAYTYLESADEYFDAMIIDFPDPKTIELSRLYSFEFYSMCHKHLRPHGVMICQSGSPYYATKAFICIEKTMQKAGFQTLPLHNQVLTLGEWGWVLAAKNQESQAMWNRLHQTKLEGIPTKWLTQNGMRHIITWGKPLIELDSSRILINSVHQPVLPNYYNRGNWDFYE